MLFSAEYFDQAGVNTIDRDWNSAVFFQIDNPAYTATNGQPARLVQAGIVPGLFTPGGLISAAGPLRGTYFGQITNGQAAVRQLEFGPTDSQWMVGGDYLVTSEGYTGSNSLVPTEKRASGFGRLSYEIPPAFTVYAQAAYSRYTGQSFYQQTPSTDVVVRSDNAFIPTAFKTALDLNKLTSCSVTTWKAGLTWQAIDDIKLRATISRDIRAPALGELFAPSTARTNTVNVSLAGGGQRTDHFTEKTTGNPLLNPEVAKTYGAGVVFPSGFLPGFAASVDYYDIKLQGAIGTVTAQTTTALCYQQSSQAFCNTTTTGTGGFITGITLIPFNFAVQRMRGMDSEASYRVPLWSGNWSLGARVMRYISNKTDNGIDFPFEGAGVNVGAFTPS